MKKQLAACLLALAAAAAQAGMGLMELPGAKGDGPVTVYYPTSAAEQPLQRGPFTFNMAWQGAPVRGNGRLVVISHGSGGAPWVHADLARALVEAGFTVALPEHKGDHYKDFSDPGPVSWKMRPAEVSRAIDAMAADSRFGPLLTLDRVGMFGGSAGGHTALSLAGGRWSPAAFRGHCQAHIEDDFSSCVGYTTRLRGNLLDGLKKAVALGVIRQRFDDETWYTHNDPRIAAVVAAVPFAADFDMPSLAVPRVPLGLVSAGKDINQVPRFHIGAVRAACAACETVADFPDASHGVMLSPTPPAEKISAIAQELNGDPPGFDRPAAVATLNRAVTAFFRKHLLP
ncbi:dienelactone hydrolase [Ramlibacter sp. WS9]|uniref:alpha/beta hydrolase family protein n=1 Tax=Ramlibacter sp. WS9 TaxID=1882741 RepID=UPI00114519B1|nr:dienelactone hydrolase [Ramlibacter sp. WS9]ROZ71494.1 dienelactone hydrolase [Ramlibacter sp. WS9]